MWIPNRAPLLARYGLKIGMTLTLDVDISRAGDWRLLLVTIRARPAIVCGRYPVWVSSHCLTPTMSFRSLLNRVEDSLDWCHVMARTG